MIYFILLLGLILRLINLNQSLWLDETINVVAVKTYSLKDLITKYSLGDFHPPLYHPFLFFWVKIFGSSEISVRIPSVIFGVITIYFTYLIAKQLIDKKTALLASFLMAIAPYHIYFSQEARMYSLEGLLGVGSIYFFIKILKENNLKNWFLYTLFITLAIYVDYFGFFIPLIPLTYFLIKKKQLVRQWLVSSFISFLAWLPWLPLFLKQFENARVTAKNMPGWANVVGNASLKNLALTFIKFSIGRISFDNKIIYGLIFVLIFLIFSFLIYKAIKKTSNFNTQILLLWLFIPLVTSFLISLFTPIYQPFRLLYLLPAMYLLLSIGCYSLLKARILSMILVIGIGFGGLLIYYVNPRFYRENWRDSVRQLEEKSGSNDQVVFTSYEPMSPYIYYQKKNLTAIGTKNLSLINANHLFLFRYLWPVFDPNDTIRKMIEKNYYLIDDKEFNGVEWQEYQRKIINFQ